MTDKYMTIVIKYQSDEMPLKGFGIPVLGCEVSALSVGDLVNEKWLLDQAISDSATAECISDIEARLEELRAEDEE